MRNAANTLDAERRAARCLFKAFRKPRAERGPEGLIFHFRNESGYKDRICWWGRMRGRLAFLRAADITNESPIAHALAADAAAR